MACSYWKAYVGWNGWRVPASRSAGFHWLTIKHLSAVFAWFNKQGHTHTHITLTITSSQAHFLETVWHGKLSNQARQDATRLCCPCVPTDTSCTDSTDKEIKAEGVIASPRAMLRQSVTSPTWQHQLHRSWETECSCIQYSSKTWQMYLRSNTSEDIHIWECDVFLSPFCLCWDTSSYKYKHHPSRMISSHERWF